MPFADGDVIWDSDVNSTAQAASGDGVFSGLSVSTSGTMSVDVAGGTYYANSRKRVVVGVSSPISIAAADPTHDRYDIVVANAAAPVASTRNNTARDVFGSNWAAQSFTSPSSETTVSGVELVLNRVGAPTGSIVVDLYTDSAGVPGTFLFSSIARPTTDVTVNGLTLDAYIIDGLPSAQVRLRQRYLFVFPAGQVALTPSTTYWLVVRGPVGDASNKIEWYYQNADVFAGGNAATSSTSGSSWTPQASQDQAFILYLGRVRVVTGSPSSNPIVPDIPSDSIRLAVVKVPAGATGLVSGNIQDTRIFIPKDWDFVVDLTGLNLTSAPEGLVVTTTAFNFSASTLGPFTGKSFLQWHGATCTGRSAPGAVGNNTSAAAALLVFVDGEAREWRTSMSSFAQTSSETPMAFARVDFTSVWTRFEIRAFTTVTYARSVAGEGASQRFGYLMYR